MADPAAATSIMGGPIKWSMADRDMRGPPMLDHCVPQSPSPVSLQANSAPGKPLVDSSLCVLNGCVIRSAPGLERPRQFKPIDHFAGRVDKHNATAPMSTAETRKRDDQQIAVLLAESAIPLIFCVVLAHLDHHSNRLRRLPRLYVARKQKHHTVRKFYVRARKPVNQLPVLPIGHDRCLAPCKAATRQKLQGHDTDPAGPVAPVHRKFDAPRIDPVLRMLIGVHYGFFWAQVVSGWSVAQRRDGWYIKRHCWHCSAALAVRVSCCQTSAEKPGARSEEWAIS